MYFEHSESAGRPSTEPRQPRPRSLRNQLVTIPTVILFAGLVAMAGTVLVDARTRIAAEVSSAMELGRELVNTSLHNVVDASSPALAFEQMAEELPRVRHVQFELVPSDGTLFHGGHFRSGKGLPKSPPWLAHVLAPPLKEDVFPIVVRGRIVGHIRLRSNPTNEIAEIVGEVELFSGTLVALCLLIVGSLLWSVRRSLRPIQLLANGFDRLERGDYRPIALIPIAEFHRIGQQFNHLAQSLCRVTEDNHRLIDKLLLVQEEERKQLAAELHDEFGPALFGIRAEVSCMLMLPQSEGRQRAGVHEHARAIAQLTDGIQKLNYRMLDRLRPLVLEQMGLREALRQLLASWQMRYPRITWSLVVPRRFDGTSEAMNLTLYRGVQEAVTNAVRHAQASEIEIRLERLQTDRGDDARSPAEGRGVLLSVVDNGDGLPDGFRYGFGLLGMTERLRQLGGTLKVMNTLPHGVIVQAWIPEQTQALFTEPLHAHSAD